MSSLEEKRLIVKIIQFFRLKILSNQLEPDQVESLEVALQCLESTFSINLGDPALQTDVDLLSVFAKDAKSKVPTDEEKQLAENLKNEGNELMKNGKFDEALEKYTQAIQIYPSPTFFCNRAAAFSKVEKHVDSVEDCKIALQLDSHYSKAYGRMGLAYSCMSKYAEARDAYKKALELEPGNESFLNNLKIAEEKLRENSNRPGGASAGGPFGGLPGFGGGAGGFNPFEMLNNPAIAQMTQQFINDPNMQNMMSGLLSGMSGGAPPPANVGQGAGAGSGGATPGQPSSATGAQNAQAPPAAGINNLLEMGQRFATMMQQQNPELVEQLRRQFQPDGHNNPDDPNNPNNPRPS